MSNIDARETKLVLDIADRVEPQSELSPYGVKSKWRVLPYTCEIGEGKMLSAIGGNPSDITYDPELKGWYKIFILFPGASSLNIKLSSDGSYMRVNSTYRGVFTLERLLWKCADMTNEKITLTKSADFEDVQTYLGGFEFIPMTEEEVAQWKYEPCCVGLPRAGGSWWRVLTKRGQLEKGMATTSVFLP